MIHGHHSRKFYVFIACVVFAAVMGGTLVYTFCQQKLYESTAKIHFDPKENSYDAEDFIETAKVLKSSSITRKVAERLITPESWDTQPLNLQTVLKPYGLPPEAGVDAIEKLLSENRKIIAHTDTYIIEVHYRHPDRLVAAKVANLFSDELIAFNARQRIGKMMIQAESLRLKADQQELKVKALEQALSAYRKSHPELTPETLESDPAYHALSLQFTTENRVLKDLIEPIRNTTMM